MPELANDEQFFHQNERQLSQRFAGKVLVIRGCKVVAVYESPAIAEREATREFGAQSFLLKPIVRGVCAPSSAL